jgi:hypothetical protein
VVLKDFIEYRRSLRGHQYSNLKQSKEIAKKWHIERSSDVSRRREIKTNFEQKLYCLFAEHIENKELITQPMITQLRGPDILPVAQNEEACENWLQEYYKSDVPPYVTSLFDEMLMKFTRKPDRWKLEGKMLNVGGYTLEGKNDFGSLSLS